MSALREAVLLQMRLRGFAAKTHRGALFAFTNSRHNRVKVLYWDGTGLWVMITRLEQCTFTWPKGVDVEDRKLSLRPEALALLLDGVDMRGG